MRKKNCASHGGFGGGEMMTVLKNCSCGLFELILLVLLQFNTLRNDLEAEFPGQLNMTGRSVKGKSGCFEVQIKGSDKTLHSKLDGEGFRLELTRFNVCLLCSPRLNTS
ncbi:hypothetical protein scyTo_0010645 [Scyliorhinus torazame]|uniref:Uncharacterized protein n=1 Tax=Scyliorhinus torazame TaxID=75743 RepID=A0A401P9R5_SCYTO|nr:hypothetical protein [Scyliorhinus torazame]